MFEELLPDMRRVLGPDHPGTLLARHGFLVYEALAGDVPPRCTC